MLMQLHEVRRHLQQWGYIVLENQGGTLTVTNNGGPKREVTHTYNDLDHLKRYLYVYKDKDADEEELSLWSPITESEQT